MIRDLGFAGSTGLRLIGAFIFSVLAATAVLMVERLGTSPVPLPAAAVRTPAISGQLILVSTFPVARWTVQAHGHDVDGTIINAQRWEAAITGDRATIFVQTEPEDPSSSLPAALRWSFAGKSGVLWGEGMVAGTLTHSDETR